MFPLKIYYQNVRGLRTKTSTFKRNLAMCDCDIIALTETWLVDGVSDSELFDDRYIVWRRDRDLQKTGQSRGGGVLLAIRREIAVHERIEWWSTAEDLWVTILLKSPHSSFKIHLCIVYLCEQNLGFSFGSQLDNHLTMVSNVMHLNPLDKFLILGDYNLSGIEWHQSDDSEILFARNSSVQTSIFNNLKDIMDIYDLHQFNYVLNKFGKILDLVLSNDILQVSPADDLLVAEDPHHKAIIMSANFFDDNTLHSLPHLKYHYHKADFVRICSELSNKPWSSKLTIGSITEALSYFYDTLYSLRDEFIPHKRVHTSKYPPWFSPALAKVLKEKYKYHKKYKKYGNLSDYLSFTCLRDRAKTLETKCFNSYMQRVESSIKNDPKVFWSYVKNMRCTKGLPSLMKYRNAVGRSGEEISDLFSNYFSTNFLHFANLPPVTHTQSNIISKMNFNNISSVEVSVSQVKKLLLSLDRSRSAGPDMIPPIYLIECADSLSLPISILFKRSIDEGVVPQIWKSAFITPIYKKGAKNNIENYRPISKLCILAKVLERIVYDQVYNSLKSSFSPYQHGFIKGRSTVSNLALFTDDVTSIIEGGGQVDVVYTDYSKAFDRIDHEILLAKLESAGIHGDLLRWFTSYVHNRMQSVVLNGYTSCWVSVPSGVPQGSLLGPLLFVIFILDIDSCFQNSNIYLFADDMKILKNIRSMQDSDQLQQDLVRFDLYCLQNKLDINVSKCSVITFTRKKHPLIFTYFLKQSAVERVDHVRDLGVILDHKLLFDKHIDYIATKAYKTLGFLIRVSSNFKNIKTLKILYCSLVRSHLEYASQVWNPSYDIYISRLESIQKKFLRFVNYKLLSNYNYETSCVKHHILPLHFRRRIADITYLMGIATGRIDCPELLSRISVRVPNKATRSLNTLAIPITSTRYRKNSFLVRASNEFNSCGIDLDLFNSNVSTARRQLSRSFFEST